MLSNIDITKGGDMMLYHFDRSGINGELVPSSVLVLNQDIVIDYWDEAQRPYFAYFFAFIYGKTDYPTDFLEYHLMETFRGDIKRYNAFLMAINYGSEQASEGYVHLLKGWIKEKMDSLQWKTLSGSTPYSFDSLMGIVASQERYDYLINVLTSKRFLNAHGAFVYAKRNKRAVSVALLETLITRQFTKEGIEWTNETKVEFLQKAWGLNVSSTSSHLRSLLPEYRKLFSFLAMAKQVNTNKSS